MKLFYGVQGTGNGHITRARLMAKELYAAGIDVTFQFTGRPHHQYFDMEIFKQYQYRAGLTFNTNKGRVSYVKSVLESKPINFIKDVKGLDLSSYDVILCDFEPVTAWAGKLQKKKVIGIGHQYAFNYNIPRHGSDPLANLVMKAFAPTEIGIGLHWHHYEQPILPPIIDTSKSAKKSQENKIVVYLPFEDQDKIVNYLIPYENFQFHIYSPQPFASTYEHISCNELSLEGFQKDLHDCSGILSNAGFELASEALHLGKKILLKPLHSQMEQISNAAALKGLNYGHVMRNINAKQIEDWLLNNRAVQINYPNTAKVIVDWIKQGMPEMNAEFIRNVWENVNVNEVNA